MASLQADAEIVGLPFRLGTTSYIIESGLAGNLLWLARRPGAVRIGEMQLVLFDTPEISNIPSPEETARLANIASEYDMAFTVHLPDGIMPGDADPSVRRASGELFARVVEATSKLEPICWVLHIPLPGEDDGGYPYRVSETLASFIERLGSPRQLAIENIHPVFEIEPPLIEELGTSVCIDVGHLIRFGSDVRSFLGRWLPRCRNMHLHGCTGTKDHESLECLPPGFLKWLLAYISSSPELRTVTAEIFGKSDFESSIAALRPVCREIFGIDTAEGESASQA
jgi:sugar phosphate isomerase/epimerase